MSAKKKNKPQPKQQSRNDMVLSRRQMAVSAEYHHSGPIPDPMTLERYDQILPGAAERIIKMAEDQSTHRREIEKIVIKSKSRDSLLGIIAGFFITIIVALIGAYVAVNGQELGGAILGGTGLVGLVSVFIYGTRSSRKERESRQ